MGMLLIQNAMLLAHPPDIHLTPPTWYVLVLVPTTTSIMPSPIKHMLWEGNV